MTAGNLLDSDVPPPPLALSEENDSDGSSALLWFNEGHLAPPVPAQVPGQRGPAQHRQPVVDTAPVILRQLQRHQVQPDVAGVGGGEDGELTEAGAVTGQGPVLVLEVGQPGSAGLPRLHQVDTAGSSHLEVGREARGEGRGGLGYLPEYCCPQGPHSTPVSAPPWRDTPAH